jgi:hypothetical protein
VRRWAADECSGTTPDEKARCAFATAGELKLTAAVSHVAIEAISRRICNRALAGLIEARVRCARDQR